MGCQKSYWSLYQEEEETLEDQGNGDVLKRHQAMGSIP